MTMTEEIVQGEWSGQLTALANAGFTAANCPDVPQLAVRLLAKFEGDIKQVERRLSNRQKVREAEAKWGAELKLFREEGLNYPLLAAKVLEETGGEVDMTRKRLQQRQQQLKHKQIIQQWPSQVTALKEEGLWFPCKASRLLEKFNGNLEAVRPKLANIKLMKERQRDVKKQQKKQQQLKADEIKWSGQLTTLANAGFTAANCPDVPQLAVRLLAKFEGDIKQVERRLSNRQKVREAEAKWGAELKLFREEGLNYPLLAAKVLEETGGEVDMTRKRLQQRQQQLKHKQIIQQWPSQVTALKEEGLWFPCKASRLLEKFNGNLEAVRPKLANIKLMKERQRDVKKQQKKQQQLKADEIKWSGQLTTLANAGFTAANCPDVPQLAVRLLAKFKGDVKQVERRLSNRQKVREAEAKWGAELKLFREEGLNYPLLAAKVLEETGGEVDMTRKRLQQRQQQLKHKQIIQQWPSQVTALKEEGLWFPCKASRLLEKFNGNLEAVRPKLANIKLMKERQRDVKKQQKKQQQLKADEIKWSGQLTALANAGFTAANCPDVPQLAVRLLAKFKGDVKQVERRLSNRQKVREAEAKWGAELKLFREEGLNYPLLAAKVLEETGGEVDMTRKRLQQRQQQLKHKQIIQQWPSQVTALKEEGLWFPCKASRLLEKFNGNLEAVRPKLANVKLMKDQGSGQDLPDADLRCKKIRTIELISSLSALFLGVQQAANKEEVAELHLAGVDMLCRSAIMALSETNTHSNK